VVGSIAAFGHFLDNFKFTAIGLISRIGPNTFHAGVIFGLKVLSRRWFPCDRHPSVSGIWSQSMLGMGSILVTSTPVILRTYVIDERALRSGGFTCGACVLSATLGKLEV